jgi:1A family penicillin-binding protein
MSGFIDRLRYSQGDKMRLFWRFGILSLFIVTIGFGIYVWSLYQQLEQSFARQEQFTPTRIYSDVTQIASPQPRALIQTRLHALGYVVSQADDSITFTLHPINYPPYLLPENHPTLSIGEKPVLLRFDGNDKDAVLQTIYIGDSEISDLYLEPELITTLSRGSERGNEIRALVQFNDIPSLVWKAIIAVEDQHFLEHAGLDPRGLARAILVNLKTHSLAQGGSTITQQLVKNLMARRNKNIFRKINEIFLALLLETKFDKEKILERYLNEVYLGQVGNLEVHGVAEGAKYFFGKRLDELNLAEITLMAGLIRGPGYYSPYRYFDRALERQRFVLKRMVETGQIAKEEADAAHALPIRLTPPQPSTNKAPFYTDFVKAELIDQLKDRFTEQEIISAGFSVFTTLDVNLNSGAQRTIADGVSRVEKMFKLPASNRLEGALAAVDHTTGYIRVLVGGRNYAQSNFNRILNMRRQVGSTFKPIVYLSAIEKGHDANGITYGPGRPVEDAPWKLIFDHGRQTWAPKNYEKEFLGWISARTALAKSINTVAAKIAVEVGIESIVETAQTLGIKSELPLVPSLSLGVAELSPVELLQAYAVIANHGIQDELTVIRGITWNDGTGFARFLYNPKQVISPGSVDLLTDMLQSVFIEGTAHDAAKFGFDRPAAGKTGTTTNHRDSWFAGFTPQLTTVVWVGIDQDDKNSKTQLKLTGANSALPIWVQFMKEALEGEPPAAFPESPHLVSVQIDKHSGKLAPPFCPDVQTVVEKYISGREPKSASCEPLWPPSVPETTIE